MRGLRRLDGHCGSSALLVASSLEQAAEKSDAFMGRRGCVMILRCSLTGQAERRIEDSQFGQGCRRAVQYGLRGTKAGPWFDSRIDDKCAESLEKIRWPKGEAVCLRCGVVGVPELPAGGRWHCPDCRYQFSVTSGTIMHDSHLPLRKWFLAIYLMCESRKGISANQLHRTLGVAYKLQRGSILPTAGMSPALKPDRPFGSSFSERDRPRLAARLLRALKKCWTGRLRACKI